MPVALWSKLKRLGMWPRNCYWKTCALSRSQAHAYLVVKTIWILMTGTLATVFKITLTRPAFLAIHTCTRFSLSACKETRKIFLVTLFSLGRNLSISDVCVDNCYYICWTTSLNRFRLPQQQIFSRPNRILQSQPYAVNILCRGNRSTFGRA